MGYSFTWVLQVLFANANFGSDGESFQEEVTVKEEKVVGR